MARSEIGNDGRSVEFHGTWGTGAPAKRWDRWDLGSCPAGEDAVQLGVEGYEALAKAECRRWIALLRQHLGPEPQGALLKVQSFRHDFGFYYEVVVTWEEGNEEAESYAMHACDPDEQPQTWGTP
jgi:hypothetical protein